MSLTRNISLFVNFYKDPVRKNLKIRWFSTFFPDFRRFSSDQGRNRKKRDVKSLGDHFSSSCKKMFCCIRFCCKNRYIIFQINNILPWTTSKNAHESTSSLIVSAEQESLYLEGSMVHSPLSFSFQQCQGHPVELLEKTVAKRKTKNFIICFFYFGMEGQTVL